MTKTKTELAWHFAPDNGRTRYSNKPIVEGDERFPVARKEHRCAECWSVIQPGEQYLYATYCYDGRWSDYKRCASCSMWARLVDCFCFGQLQDALIERFLRGQRPSQFWMEPGEKIKHWWGDPVTPEEVVNWTC